MHGSRRARLLAATSVLTVALVGVPASPAQASTPTGVAVAITPTGNGSWIASGSGAVRTSGDAPSYGSSSRPVVDLAPTRSGRGYWLLSDDGTVQPFGAAIALGSVTDPAHRPFVALAPTPTGLGYWVVAADGAVYGFGDARFHGSLSHGRTTTPIVDATSAPDGLGYWLLAQDGTVTGFGSSVAAGRAPSGAIAIVAGPNDHAYWVAVADGRLLSYGGAAALRSVPVDGPVADVAVRPQGDAYVPVASEHTVHAASAGGAVAQPSDADFDRLAQCESSGRWNLDTGNGYYGGLQFSLSTWQSLGGTGKPSDHSREDQIAIGRKEWQARGWSAWPSCSKQAGLS